MTAANRPLGRTPSAADTSLVNPLESPVWHVGGEFPGGVGRRTQGVAQFLEGVAANGHIVVIAAGVANGIPQLIETDRSVLNRFA